MSDFFVDISDDKRDISEEIGDVAINRSIYNDVQFSSKFLKPVKEESTSTKLRECCSSLRCSKNTLVSFIFSVLPVLRWLPKYEVKKDAIRDFAGGLTVGIMQVPQGMAYAMLTTLPPIYGLYVSFVPTLVYFFFGTSRHISLGTFAVVCLMNGEVIQGMTSKFTPKTIVPLLNSSINATGSSTANALLESEIAAYRVQVAVSLCCIVGLIQIVLGIIRLGFVTMYLSDPLVSGFTTGCAFHILSSQVRHFLGLTVPSGTSSGLFGLFKLYYYFLTHLKEVNVSALIIGIICTIILFVLKYLNQKYKWKFPIPAELIVVVLGAGISYGGKFNKNFQTPILKSVPKGMPAITLPSPSIMSSIIAEGFTIGIVAFAINVSLVKAFAKKNNYETDSNQELIAYGLANSVSSFFSCFPSAVSLSRSLIQESLGSTQVAGLMSVFLVLLVLFSMAPLFEPLPNAVLAGIVLAALKGLFKQFTVLVSLWKISKIDWFVWLTSFLAVLCLGVDYGLAVGLVITLLTVVARTSRPSLNVLGRIPGSEVYKSNNKYHVQEIPGVKIIQYSAPLYYANIEHFLNQVLLLTKSEPSVSKQNRNLKVFSVKGIENTSVTLEEISPSNGGYAAGKYEKTNGHTQNGHEQNGHTKNGHIQNGHTENGHIRNGDIENAHTENGPKGNGHIENGPKENGHMQNDDIENDHLQNDDVENDHKQNDDKENDHIQNGDTEDCHIQNGDIENSHVHMNHTEDCSNQNGHIENGHIENGHIENGHTLNGYGNSSTDEHEIPQYTTSSPKLTKRRPSDLPPSLGECVIQPKMKCFDTSPGNEQLHSIVVDCSLFSYIDSMAVSTFGNMVKDFKKKDIEVFLASCSDNVMSMLHTGGFLEVHGRHRIFITVHDAVMHCLSATTLRNGISSSGASTSDMGESNPSLSDEEVQSTLSHGDNTKL